MDGFWWCYFVITTGIMWLIAHLLKDLIESKRLMMCTCIAPIVFSLLLLLFSSAGGFVVESALSLNKFEDKVTTFGLSDQEFTNLIIYSANITSVLTLIYICVFSVLLILTGKSNDQYARLEKRIFISLFLALYIYSVITLNLYI